MTLTVRARVETWEAKSRRAQKESNSRAGVKPMDNDITLRAIKKLTMGEREVENLSGGSFQLDERRVATHRTKLTSAAPISLSKREGKKEAASPRADIVHFLLSRRALVFRKRGEFHPSLVVSPETAVKSFPSSG